MKVGWNQLIFLEHIIQLQQSSYKTIQNLSKKSVMKTAFIVVFLSVITLIHGARPPSSWKINNNDSISSIWRHFGAQNQIRSQFCRWSLDFYGQNMYLDLYDDLFPKQSLKIEIGFNYSINKLYPYYQGKAYINYSLIEYQKRTILLEGRQYLPFISLEKNILTITQSEGEELTVFMVHQDITGLLFLYIGLILIKVPLFYMMLTNFKKYQMNSSLSYFIFWESQVGYCILKSDFMNFEDTTGRILFLACIFGILFPHLLLFKSRLMKIDLYFLFFFLWILNLEANVDINIVYIIFLPLLQIIMNVFRNYKQPIGRWILSLYLINISIALYLKGCPHNFFMVPTNYYHCSLILILAAIQITILQLQRKFGPFFGLKKIRLLFLGSWEIVFTQITTNVKDQQNIHKIPIYCQLCLGSLREQGRLYNLRIMENGDSIGSIVSTSCKHRFHYNCLKQWMKNNDFCPIDYQHLPNMI